MEAMKNLVLELFLAFNEKIKSISTLEILVMNFSHLFSSCWLIHQNGWYCRRLNWFQTTYMKGPLCSLAAMMMLRKLKRSMLLLTKRAHKVACPSITVPHVYLFDNQFSNRGQFRFSFFWVKHRRKPVPRNWFINSCTLSFVPTNMSHNFSKHKHILAKVIKYCNPWKLQFT